MILHAFLLLDDCVRSLCLVPISSYSWLFRLYRRISVQLVYMYLYVLDLASLLPSWL